MSISELKLYNASVDIVKKVDSIISENPEIKTALAKLKKLGYVTNGPHKTGYTTVSKDNIVIYVANQLDMFIRLDVVNVYNSDKTLLGSLLGTEVLNK